MNPSKNKFLLNLKNHLENEQFKDIIYWISENSFIIKDLSELIVEGSPFKNEETFHRNLLEYEFTKKKSGQKLTITHKEFKKGLTDDEIGYIQKRKKQNGGGNFHKALIKKLKMELEEAKEFLKLEKELRDFKWKIMLKKIILQITKNKLKIYLLKTACFKIFDDNNKKNFLYLIRNYLHDIIADEEKLIKFINMKKKLKKNESHNDNDNDNDIPNVIPDKTIFDSCKYYKMLESSGINKNDFNLDQYRSTGFEQLKNNFNNPINNENNETIEYTS